MGDKVPPGTLSSIAKRAGLERMRNYTVFVESAEDGTWIAYVPDLPGCTAGGATAEKTRGEIGTSIRRWLEETRAQGERIPRALAHSFVVAGGPAPAFPSLAPAPVT